MKKSALRRAMASGAALLLATGALPAAADSIANAIQGGDAYFDFNLRYEGVEQDNSLDDAQALTLRSRIGYVTAPLSGFAVRVEFEDLRNVAGMDRYSVPATGYNPGQYSVIADPETTELDQGYIRYRHEALTAKLGRQVITLDNHRFVGDVGWRQDRQTFDGASAVWAPTQELTATYAYLEQRNRIFAEAGDLASSDHLLNLAYQFAPGTLTVYSYLLELDEGSHRQLDNYGVRFAGDTGLGNTTLLYELEYARQSAETRSEDFDAGYYRAVIGLSASGASLRVGYEVLGSDGGAYGFATPLATLHKFNGWADMFLQTPAEGLEDMYVSLSTPAGPGSLSIVYHEFSAEDASNRLDELGRELDLAYTMTFADHYRGGIKYAAYSADDFADDTDKLWLWVGASF